MTTKTIETAGDRIEQALTWRDNRILFLQDQLAEQAIETASLKRQIASMQIEYQQQLDDKGDRIEQALKWRDNRILFLQDQLAAVTTERDDLHNLVVSLKAEINTVADQLIGMENDRDAQRQRADWYEQDEFKKATELAKLRSALKHSQNQHHDHGHAPDIDIVNGF